LNLAYTSLKLQQGVNRTLNEKIQTTPLHVQSAIENAGKSFLNNPLDASLKTVSAIGNTATEAARGVIYTVIALDSFGLQSAGFPESPYEKAARFVGNIPKHPEKSGEKLGESIFDTAFGSLLYEAGLKGILPGATKAAAKVANVATPAVKKLAATKTGTVVTNAASSHIVKPTVAVVKKVGSVAQEVGKTLDNVGLSASQKLEAANRARLALGKRLSQHTAVQKVYGLGERPNGTYTQQHRPTQGGHVRPGKKLTPFEKIKEKFPKPDNVTLLNNLIKNINTIIEDPFYFNPFEPKNKATSKENFIKENLNIVRMNGLSESQFKQILQKGDCLIRASDVSPLRLFVYNGNAIAYNGKNFVAGFAFGNERE
jgi:hypothetical protein